MPFQYFCVSDAVMAKEIKTHESKRTASGLNTLSSETMPLLRRLIGKKGMMAADILAFWEQIAGEELAAFTFPEKISFKTGERRDGTLQVAVINGAFALELQHRERFVLEKVNSFFCYKAVTKLKIRQSAGLSTAVRRQFNQPELKKTLVSSEEQNYIEQLSEGLSDNELHSSLVRLGKSVLSQNRNKQEQQ